MWQRFYAVAANTFVETIRQPIYGVMLVVTTILLILNVALTLFTLYDDDKLLIDVSLSTILLAGLFLSAFSASGILNREISNKTVLSVISKPINRPVFILGKFAGLFAALVLAYYICFLIFVLIIRHGVMPNKSDPWDGPVLVLGFGSIFLAFLAGGYRNYLYGKHFATTCIGVATVLLTLAVLLVARFDKHWDVVPYASTFVGGQVIIAAYLVLLNVILMAAIAVAASTRFGSLMTLVICTVFLVIGMTSDYAFGQHADTSTLARLAYGFLPNLGPFWVIDGLYAESEKTTIPGNYVAYATCYAGLWTVGIISIAVAAFQKREVG